MDEAVDTRERILDAALAVMARLGHAKATTREIARAAGVAQGLPNYHFGSREALLREVVASVRERYMSAIAVHVPEADGPETLRHVLELTRALLDFEANWYRLLTDIDAGGLRDPQIAGEAVAIKQAGTEAVRVYVDRCYESFGLKPPGPGDPLASVALAAFDGLAVRVLLEPAFDHLGAFQVLERMLIAVISPGAEPVDRPWRTNPLGVLPPA